MFWIASTSWVSSLSRSKAASLYFDGQPEPDVERVEQLEPDPLLLVQRVEQVVLHRAEAALLPQLLLPLRPPVRLRRASMRLPGRNRQRSRELSPRSAGGILAYVADDLLALFGPGQDVDLVDDEDDLLAPLPDLLEEGRARSR